MFDGYCYSGIYHHPSGAAYPPRIDMFSLAIISVFTLFIVFLPSYCVNYYRFQSAQPAADSSAQIAGVVVGARRVPAVGHDVRQLSQAARVQRGRVDARQASPRRIRGPTLLPPLVSVADLTLQYYTVIFQVCVPRPPFVCNQSELLQCDGH